MAIFGIFGKKDSQPVPSPEDKEGTRNKRGETTARPDQQKAPASPKTPERSGTRAATAKKIDAIESEMSSEFSPSTITESRTVHPAAPRTASARPAGKTASAGTGATTTTQPFEPTLPNMGTSTEFLLGEEGKPIAIEIANSGASQVIEEAAILFANGQTEMVEQILLGAIYDEAIENGARVAWWMLFDLYQVSGKRQQFDNLSIDYASKFETSPPSWVEVNQTEAAPAPKTGATPAVAFTGKLDSNIIKMLERVQKLAQNNRMLRLEFVRVTDVDPIGCGLLLKVLKKLQSSEHDLVLVGAPELAAKIRSILQVGRRDETEAPWLLLLELLRLLNSEKEFEEASIDYCITFEVSPPAFVPPKNKVTTEVDEIDPGSATADTYSMPAVIEGKTEPLLGAINVFAAEHQPAILDCSRLTRVDFSAAGELLTGFAPLCGSGKTIELHNVNHLIAALFNVLGLNEIVRVVPRKL